MITKEHMSNRRNRTHILFCILSDKFEDKIINYKSKMDIYDICGYTAGYFSSMVLYHKCINHIGQKTWMIFHMHGNLYS